MSGLRVALLIDGGHLRVLVRKTGQIYDPDFIERFATGCVAGDERLIRVLYYDCAPYNGSAKGPVSGNAIVFKGDDGWLRVLAAKDLFAIRLGVLKFRGWSPRKLPLQAAPLSDADFAPNFEQKGVDMRIGLDVATFSESKSVDRLILVTADTDCAPAMKYARIAGLQTVLVALPNRKPVPELQWHADYTRTVAWPNP